MDSSRCWTPFQLSHFEMEQSWSLGWIVVLAKAASAKPRASDKRVKDRGGLKFHEELIFVHGLVSVSGKGSEEGDSKNHIETSKEKIFHI